VKLTETYEIKKATIALQLFYFTIVFIWQVAQAVNHQPVRPKEGTSPHG
jgi:hypothetical protein